MAIETKRAKRLLSEADQIHLTQVGIESFREFMNRRKIQLRSRPPRGKMCEVCNKIAEKFGVD